MKVVVDGKQVEVLPRDFAITREEWNEYHLLDGGTIRFKAIVTQIFRVLDDSGKPAFNKDGEPLYLVRTTNSVVARE